VTQLTIPEVTGEDDTISAALKYAAAGFYVLPVSRASKHAGSVVGKGWPSKSSRDPEQIVAWFAGSSDSLALHIGRSGAVAFDVDEPNQIPQVLTEAVAATNPPYQSTREHTEGRGHYVFTVPPGRVLGNSTGSLGKGWGEVRGANGIIVVAPSVHEKHAQGARYQWMHTGPVPELPGSVATLLRDASDTSDAATDGQVREFIEKHTTAARPELLGGILTQFATALEQGQSRHDAAVLATASAVREAAAGIYPAKDAAEQLFTAFAAALEHARNGSDRTRSKASARAEYLGILAWSIGQLTQADIDTTRASLEQRLPPTDHSRESYEALIADPAPTTAAAKPTATGPMKRSWDDIGNAQRLLDRYGHVLRWTLAKKSGEWGVYDGRRWAFRGGDTLVRTLARQTVEDLPSSEAGAYSNEPQFDLRGKEKPSLRDEFLAFVSKSRDHRAMGRGIAAASTFPEAHARPEDFDADRRWLNLPNGVLDTDRVQLLPHDPALMLSKMFAVPYTPDAEAPAWERFLEMNIPDLHTRLYLQRAVGYTLSGLSNEKTLIYLYGPSDTGKSIFTGIMGRLFGIDYGIAASDGALRPRREGAINNDVDDMAGKRFVTTSESRPGEELDEALVKRLTGRDEQRSRALYENNRSWTPECVIWVCSNQYPKITGDDDAIWTRIRVVPFLRQFLAGDPDRDERLEEKLHAELEGIFAWAVRGLVMYLRDGLAPPPEVVQAGEQFRATADGVTAFVAEYAEEEFVTVEEHGWAPRTDLYEMYKRWCKDSGLRQPLRPSRFYTRLGVSYREAKVNGTRGHKGISLGPKTPPVPVGWSS